MIKIQTSSTINTQGRTTNILYTKKLLNYWVFTIKKIITIGTKKNNIFFFKNHDVIANYNLQSYN